MEKFKQKIPIGLVIKQIAEEKNLSANELAKKVGYSRQGVYSVFGRTKMSNDEIELWANALGVNKDEIVSDVLSTKSKDNLHDSPNDYLMKYIESLEKRIAEQEKTITVLLGKSVSVSSAEYGVVASFFGVIGLIFGYTTLS